MANPNELFKATVQKSLACLNVSKASGMSIPTLLIQVGTEFIAPPLTHIINLSLETNTVLKAWKTAIVTPLHKDSRANDSYNYRPLSVIPVFMKIFEKMIHNQLYDHFNTNGLLNACQSGFRPRHSTSTALLNLSDFLLKKIDEGNFIGSIFLDLNQPQRAADKTITSGCPWI